MRKFIVVSCLAMLVAFSVTAEAAPVLHFSASEKFVQSQSVSIGSVSIRNTDQGDQQVAFQLNGITGKVNAHRHFNPIVNASSSAEVKAGHYLKKMTLQHSQACYEFIQQILFPNHHFW
ncbi:hypothetical protein [Pollutibacter soli]|uniref:hypothetical protein n=1 Tax=Pollutibacter soli TaxID=3034157 RepID=UPI003013A919